MIFPFLKRFSDILISLILIFLLLPFFLLIVLRIKMENYGSIIFIQKRIGKFGKEFKIYKFRTMNENKNSITDWINNSDNNCITKIGEFLRSKGLDELPQLINVLKGDMTLIGPRPELPELVATYNNLHKKRLSVTPGITGLWQVLAPKNEPIHNNIKFDLYYIKKRNLRLDIWILIKTIPIFFGKGDLH